ncbi:helix-turn-helix domain-containing protein [Ureibacillus chungkukjangi]|uniref:helix-turn-helix domain-containing protein n=1 Tax=Ureibacillus chungkukjangi TaxID=1202712 RepID=UPI002041AC62|nr:Rgg/GadR/MutR family transcriptional regulator [Ureibacillus chungkukjangi]MCM3388117.1 helix-turn-helix domain-containing protein [Ureibacillus chungkukjangi]
MEIGQVIKYIRTNKKITQQELATAIGMTRPYIARIESGKNSISSDKLTEILEYCNVTYNEFFYIKNDYTKSSKMNEFNRVVELYYSKNYEEISEIKKRVKEKYDENGDIFLRHLYILCHCIENDLDPSKIKDEYINELADYLLSMEEWCFHELVILNNFIYLFPPETAFLMTKNLLYRAEKYKNLNLDKNIMSYLFFNLLEFSFKYEGYQYSKIILDATKKYYITVSDFFEQTLLIYYEGMLDIVENSIEEGIEKCERAFIIFQTLGHESIYQKYKADLEELLSKVKNKEATAEEV